MTFAWGSRSGKVSRRDVLKGGATLGGTALGLGIGFGSRPTWADDLAKIKVLDASGNVQLVNEVLFKELGLYKKYGVDPQVSYVADTNKITAGLIGGDADMCAGSGFSGLFPAIDKGATLKIVAGADIAPTNILYSSKPEIKSVKDLPGHTVGTGAPGSLLHELTVGLMQKYGVDYKSVRFVNIGASGDVYKALVAGSVDAGVAPIDFQNTSVKSNVYPLVDGEFWKQLPLYANQAMYASDRAISENRRGIVGMLASYGYLFQWIRDRNNKAAYLKYYAQAIPHASEEEAAFLYDFLSKPGVLSSDMLLSPDQIKYVQDLNVELGVQTNVVPYEKCTDMSLAKEAMKLVNG